MEMKECAETPNLRSKFRAFNEIIPNKVVFRIANAICLLIVFVTTATADRVVMTNTGPIQGITVSEGELEIEAFLGIPYAEPPVGRFRFRKPVPKTHWTGVYDASHQSPACFQNASSHYYDPVIASMSEDCLYLNVWAPYAEQETGPKAILFYIHGGAFSRGSSNTQIYDGANLARFGDVIFVGSNYRVGVFGFFSAFTEDADGNMGIYDIITALRWVKDNAKSFGGDPDNIVLMGQSAGAITIGILLESSIASDLFKRVIMQSGGGLAPLLLDDNVRLYDTSQRIATLTGCANKTSTLRDEPGVVVKCMQHLPAQVLANAEGRLMQQSPITFYPRIGNTVAPKPPQYFLRDGEFKDAEMLIGTIENEGSLFLVHGAPEYFGLYGNDRISTISRRLAYEMVKISLRNVGQKNEKEIADQYIGAVQNGTTDAYIGAISNAIGDYLVSCAAVYQADFHSIRNPVYFYRFGRRPSSTPNAEWMKTTHFDEMQYVFGNPLFANFTPEEAELSERIMSRWIAFAKTGNPNVPGEVKWPVFTMEDPKYLEIEDGDTVRTRSDNYRCEFWRDRFQVVFDDDIVAKIRAHHNH